VKRIRKKEPLVPYIALSNMTFLLAKALKSKSKAAKKFMSPMEMTTFQNFIRELQVPRNPCFKKFFDVEYFVIMADLREWKQDYAVILMPHRESYLNYQI